MAPDIPKKGEIKFLLDLLQPYRLRVMLFLTGSLLVSLFDGVSIGLLIPIINIWQGGSQGGDLPGFIERFAPLLQPYPADTQLILLILIVIAAVMFKNILLGATVTQGLWFSNQAAADARTKILDVLLTVNLQYHHQSKSGEILEKTINHIDVLKDIITALVEFVVFGLMSLILLVMMVLISWQLTLLSILLGSILMVFLFLYTKQLSTLGKQTSKAKSDLTHAVQENLSAVRLIQSSNKQGRQLNDLRQKIAFYTRAEIRTMSRVSLITPLSEALGAVGMGALLLISMVLLPGGTLPSLALVLPFLYLLLRNVQNLRYLNNLGGSILSYWPYLAQVHDMARIDNKPFIEDGKINFPGLQREISFRSVSFAYGDKYVLEEADFTIPQGKTTAIIGESGAGKSTIVNLLMRFYDPLHGNVFIDDRSLTEYQLASYRDKIGVVSQDTFIFNQSVYDNIGFGLGISPVPREMIIDAAKRAGADEFILRLDQGYDTLLGDRGVILSGGQKQRISIARAILKDPEILILDEATSSLDTITEQSVHEAILSLQEKRTTIIIAHRLSSLRHTDQIIVLQNGRIVESGTPQKLLKNKKGYFNLIHTA